MKKKFLCFLSISAIICSCNSNVNSASENNSIESETINESISESSSSISSESISENTENETYATVYSSDEVVYVFGYVGEEAFNLSSIDKSKVYKGTWSYKVDNENVTINNEMMEYNNTGLTTVLAQGGGAIIKIIVVINDSLESKYNYPINIPLNDYQLRSGTSSTVIATNNALNLNAVGQSDWTRITYNLPEYLNKDYVLEADITFQQVSSNDRWFGLVFRDQETDTEDAPYYQFDIRNNTSLANGVELTYVYAERKYSYPYSGSFVNGKTYGTDEKIHLKVVISDYTAIGYINGEEAFKTILPTNDGGAFGFQTSGAKVKIENVNVSYADIDSSFEPKKVVSYANFDASKVSINKTSSTKPNIISSGTCLDEVWGVGYSAQQFYAKANVNGSDITLFDTDNQKMDEGIEEIVSMTKGYYIPNIEVDNNDEAKAVIDRFNSLGLIDYALWSTNLDTLTYINSITSIPRLGYVSNASELTSSTLVAQECIKAGSHFAYMILIDNKLLNKEIVSQFTGRGYTVVADATNGEAGDVIGSALSGCSLILTKYTEQVAKEVALLDDKTKFEAYSLFQMPYATAHRGAGTNGSNPSYPYGENTISSFEWAFNNGARALEIDVHQTLDKKLAVIHDDSTNAYSSTNLKVKNSTLEQLQSIKLNGTNDHIPSLDEVFSFFSDKKYIDKTMVIEVKDNLVDTGIAIIEKAKEMNWYGRFVLITFNSDTAAKLHNYDPSIPVGFLNTVYRTTEEEYWAAENAYISNGVNFSSHYSTVNKTGIDNANARGELCWLWTFDNNSANSLVTHILNGNKCFTTNYIQSFTNNPYKLETDKLEYSLAVNESKAFIPQAVDYVGNKIDIDNCEIVLISGNATISGNTITKADNNEIKICLKYKTSWNLSNTVSQSFVIYSDVITIK